MPHFLLLWIWWHVRFQRKQCSLCSGCCPHASGGRCHPSCILETVKEMGAEFSRCTDFIASFISTNLPPTGPTALQLALQFSHPSPVFWVILFTLYSAMRSQAHDWKFLGALLINTHQKYHLPVWSFFLWSILWRLPILLLHVLCPSVSSFCSLFPSYLFLFFFPFTSVLYPLYSFGLLYLCLRRDAPEFKSSWLFGLGNFLKKCFVKEGLKNLPLQLLKLFPPPAEKFH